MKFISIDVESFASVDLAKCGLYKYAEAVDFEILLFSYSIDGGKVQTVDFKAGEKLPLEIINALTDDNVTKWAFNANFERVCLSRYLSDMSIPLDPFADNHFSSQYLGKARYLNPDSWRCSMVWSAYMGLPLSLESVGTVLGLEKQKLNEGKSLIRYFCQPCSPTKVNGGRTRNLPEHAPDKWEQFKEYNRRDVEVEMAIQTKLEKFPVPDSVWEEYRLDQEINDRGVLLDMTLVQNAMKADEISRSELTRLMRELTALDNPNSVQQMKQWLGENGLITDTLGKKTVAELIKTASEPLRQVLSLRQALAKSSVKKYQAMDNAVCIDGRVRGMFQFYGANRTGRWSGRLIQLQNCPQNHLYDLEQARGLVRNGNFVALEMLYDSVPEVLSELIRTALVPKDGCKFIVADFSAIEARVLSWIARENWRNEVFAGGDDIYCMSASQMFGVPVVKNGENGHLRQKGKVAELACIAKGQLVLTHIGEVPIENITKEHLLWDGESWVTHDGVAQKGVKEVIDYGGLQATADHLVWVNGKSQPIRFGVAAAFDAHLVQTGNGRQAIRLGENHITRETMEQGNEPLLCSNGMYGLQAVEVYDILNAGKNHRFTVSGVLVHNCGYGGSTGALKSMGALEMGLSEDELQPLVSAWRSANPNIVRLWWEVDRAALTAVRDITATETHGIRFSCQSGMLFITLPSGRRLAYVKPRIGENRYGSPCVTYEGVGGTKKWERLESYGPKFVENIIQAISRDILAYAMQTLRNCFIVGHIHDEVILEADSRMSPEVICQQMSRIPPWAKGLLLKADGYETKFYRKD